MPKVKGKLFWCKVNSLDTRFEPKWSVDWVGSAKEAKKLSTLGLKPKRVDELTDGEEMAAAGDYKYKFTRNLKKKKSDGMNPKPKCVLQKSDGSKEWYNDSVGNGSEGYINFGIYNWEYKGRTGISGDFKGVIVTKLVEYIPDTPVDEDEDDMFGDVDGDAPEEKDYSEVLAKADSQDTNDTGVPDSNPNDDDEDGDDW